MFFREVSTRKHILNREQKEICLTFSLEGISAVWSCTSPSEALCLLENKLTSSPGSEDQF